MLNRKTAAAVFAAICILFSILLPAFAGSVEVTPAREIEIKAGGEKPLDLFGHYTKALMPGDKVTFRVLGKNTSNMAVNMYLKAEDPVNDWAYTLMSQLYIALPFSLLNVLAFRSTGSSIVYSYRAPLSVFDFLWINDAGAYICGSLLGKHKLFPRISPGKSWEGR